MKKIFILILFLIIAASPYVAGLLLEKQYNTTISYLNNFYSGNVKFTGAFNRGYVKSSATTEVALMRKPVSIELGHVIHHGPIILEGNTPLDFKLGLIDTVLEGELNTVITNAYNGKEAYSISSTISYVGDMVTKIKNNPLKMDEKNISIDWSGVDSTIAFNKQTNKLDVDTVIPFLNYSEKVNNTSKVVILKNVKILSTASLDFSDSKISADEFTVKIADKVIVYADKPSISGYSNIENNILNSRLIFAFDKLKVINNEYGPFVLSIKVNNAHVNDDEVNNFELSPEEALSKLKSERVAIDIDIKLDTPKGKIDGVATFKFGGKKVTSIDADSILDGSKLKANVKINRAIVDMLLSEYVEDRISTLEKTFVSSNEKPSNSVNPSVLDNVTLQTIKQAWVIKLFENMEKEQLIIDTESIISTNLEFYNGIFKINEIPRTMDDWEKIKLGFDVKLGVTKSVPPPVVPPAPAGTAIDPLEPPPADEKPINTAPVNTMEEQISNPDAPSLSPLPYNTED